MFGSELEDLRDQVRATARHDKAILGIKCQACGQMSILTPAHIRFPNTNEGQGSESGKSSVLFFSFFGQSENKLCHVAFVSVRSTPRTRLVQLA